MTISRTTPLKPLRVTRRDRRIPDVVADAVAEPAGRLRGEPLSLHEILAIPAFEGCSEALLKKNEGAVVRRRYAAGETICRDGEFGSTSSPANISTIIRS